MLELDRIDRYTEECFSSSVRKDRLIGSRERLDELVVRSMYVSGRADRGCRDFSSDVGTEMSFWMWDDNIDDLN